MFLTQCALNDHLQWRGYHRSSDSITENSQFWRNLAGLNNFDRKSLFWVEQVQLLAVEMGYSHDLLVRIMLACTHPQLRIEYGMEWWAHFLYLMYLKVHWVVVKSWEVFRYKGEQ